jgi:cytochrome c2
LAGIGRASADTVILRLIFLATLLTVPHLAAFAATDAAPRLRLARERASPTDLALTGRLAGVPAGESRYVPWADLAALPHTKLRLTGEFVPGEQEVTVVYLSDLWTALPRAPGADTLLATCTDGYASVYRAAFIRDYRPFLILAINGQGPEKWPPPGLTFNPGPYVISVAASVVPAVAQLLDAGHKRPWGVTTIEVARYDESFAGILTGKWAALSPRAVEGREIWVHSCTSCHSGPDGSFGGTKSERPFAVLAAHAEHNAGYFRRYVRDPKGFAATAKMEAHPHYTDAQLDALIAFITAEGKK